MKMLTLVLSFLFTISLFAKNYTILVAPKKSEAYKNGKKMKNGDTVLLKNKLFKAMRKAAEILVANKGDTVIYSSKAIPGNEKDILKVKNQLLKKGAVLKTVKEDENIHASGHSNAEGLKTILNILKPKTVIPVHGTIYQQKALEDIALNLNIQNIIIPSLGDIYSYDGELKLEKNLEIKTRFSDITGFDDMDYSIIKERDKLKYGVAFISVIIDKKDYFLFKNPSIVIKGYVDEKYLKKITDKTEEIIFKEISKSDLSKKELLQDKLTLSLKRFFKKNYNISPALIIMIDYI